MCKGIGMCRGLACSGDIYIYIYAGVDMCRVWGGDVQGSGYSPTTVLTSSGTHRSSRYAPY